MFVFCLSASPLDGGTFARVAPVINGRTRWIFGFTTRLSAMVRERARAGVGRGLFAALAFSFLALPLSGATMVRVGRVIDSRTIVVDGGATVTLRGVDIAPADEAMAADYLRSILTNAWVLVENGGDVYRSPDALYVNGQMITHAYRSASKMTYLGESMPAPNARTNAPAVRTTSAAHAAPPRRAPHRHARGGFVPKKRGV